MRIDWTTIANWGALISVAVAVIALILQSKLTIFNLTVDLLIRLEDRFNSEPMLKVRRKAARALLTKKSLMM